jgi:hypothetical protein
MASQREGSVETASEKRFKALWLAVEGGSTGPRDLAPGMTADGRYGYRYDDEGRFWAAPISPRSWPSYLNDR